MTAGIMGRVQLLQAEAQKQGRMLKDIHVFCKWQYARETGHNSSNAGPPLPATTYSGFSASQAYDEGDLPRLIQSRSSVLSLQIEDLFDDSVSVTWTPDTSSKAPPRRMQSVFCTSQPSFDELGGMQSPPLELQGSEGSLELISKIYSIDQQSSERKLRRRAMAMATAFERGARYSPSIFAAPYSMMASLLRVVEGANDAIAGDLKMMRSKICLIEASTKDIEPSGILDRAALEVYENVSTASTKDLYQAISNIAPLVPEILQGIGYIDKSFRNIPITADEALSADLVAQLFGAGTIRGLERSWRGGDGSIDVGGLSLFALQDEKHGDGDAEMKRPGGDIENNARVYSLCRRDR
ncbi:hypothetical protein AUP68_15183 [Ilyonectria robusta]